MRWKCDGSTLWTNPIAFGFSIHSMLIRCVAIRWHVIFIEWNVVEPHFTLGHGYVQRRFCFAFRFSCFTRNTRTSTQPQTERFEEDELIRFTLSNSTTIRREIKVKKSRETTMLPFYVHALCLHKYWSSPPSSSSSSSTLFVNWIEIVQAITICVIDWCVAFYESSVCDRVKVVNAWHGLSTQFTHAHAS